MLNLKKNNLFWEGGWTPSNTCILVYLALAWFVLFLRCCAMFFSCFSPSYSPLLSFKPFQSLISCTYQTILNDCHSSYPQSMPKPIHVFISNLSNIEVITIRRYTKGVFDNIFQLFYDGKCKWYIVFFCLGKFGEFGVKELIIFDLIPN